MSAPPLEFDSVFTTDLIDEASISFVRGYLFHRYGRLLIAACLINAVGFAFALWLGATDALLMAFVAFIVVMGPVYFASFYFFYPRRFAERLKKYLMPSAHFSLDASALSISTKKGSGTVPWSAVKAVLKYPAYFILVLSPIAFSVIPKAGLPIDARRFLGEKGAV
jgi:hypothetical protein